MPNSRRAWEGRIREPALQGKDRGRRQLLSVDGEVYVTRGDDMRFFSALGFRVPQMPMELVEPPNFGRLDVDVLIWDLATEREERAVIDADPRLNALRVMRDKRAVYIEGDLSNGFSSQSVLSLQFVLDKIAPFLQAVPG